MEETENKLDWEERAHGKRIKINDKNLTVILYEDQDLMRQREMFCKVNVNLNDVCKNAN